MDNSHSTQVRPNEAERSRTHPLPHLEGFESELRIGFDLTETLHQMLVAATQEIGVEDGSVLVLDEGGHPLRWFYHRRGDTDLAELDTARALLDRGMLGWVVREKRGDIVADLANDPRWLKLPDYTLSIERGSAICVPLLLVGRVVGVLMLFHPDLDFFKPHHLSLLQDIAGQTALAVENARLYAAVRRWAEDMTALYETTLNIAADQPLDRLMNTIIAQAMDLLHCQGGALFLWRDQENVLELAATYDAEIDLKGLRVAADKGLAGHVFQSGELLVVNEQDWATDSQNQLLHFAGVPATSALAVPLVWHGRRVGVLVAFERTPGYRFDDTARRLATFLANQAAAALVSAELHAQTTRRLQELTFLNETTLAITSTLDLDQILNTLTTKIKDLLGIEACSIALVERETGDLTFKVASGGGAQTVIGQRVPAGQGIVGAAAQSARPVNVPEVSSDKRFLADFDKKQTDFVSRSILAVPMISRGQVVGVVEGLNKPGGFDQEDERLLSALANLAASIVDNAALFEQVQAAENRFQSLFEDAADAVWVTDVGGIIVQANRKAELLTGHTPNELPGSALTALTEPGESDKLDEALTLAIQGAEVTTEVWITGAGDHSIPLELRVKRVGAADYAHVQWIGRDVSDRRELEQLREDLTHMLIHDLKSPLGTVMNSLNMLQEMSAACGEDQMNRVLDIGLRASSRMAHMIGSILDIGRLEAGQPLTNLGPVSIGPLIRSAVELVAPLAHYKRITLSVDLAERLPVIVGDAPMLERVIVNLLDNGLKFTPANGAVSLSVRVETVDGAPALCVGVRDTGPGVPPSVQHRIFDKFARAQNIPQADGVGLGLSFCRLAVEAHGGRIWVESTPGQGAAFVFSLPLSQPDLAKTST